jgi:hypothetical protein
MCWLDTVARILADYGGRCRAWRAANVPSSQKLQASHMPKIYGNRFENLAKFAGYVREIA